ncbi:hydrolase 1, exosortase A system-associated [Parasphingopyxis lamellibrachiae]|uniref:Exosortase A-associated hydrolase 1 n=1 Tax=Parasphingopyxis lamellibrachiae TaxID=680125 RepID=A0A3D9FDM9_9SPHN|nr:hydrolase 1, exosortase A system-associated [Parasphingopyxis lamellibrachiae]RED15677.1 exosortase A-associated hydrolase 1 [Parasphingopyxis lamellibrachiae]
MRTQFAFDCKGDILAGALDAADGAVGVLVVTGGGQTRFGAHRGFAQLATFLAEAGYPVLRYDRRGVGDSSGEDPGFEASAPDLSAAVTAFRKEVPGLTHIVGFGLCDGATTLCLHHRECDIDAMLLANPWVVEAAANEPPPAAIKSHYRDQLLSFAGWKRLLTGGINYRKAISGILKLAKPRKVEGSLGQRVATALGASDAPAHIVLAKDDATAIGFDDEWRNGALAALSGESRFSCDMIETDAHSFARDGDFERYSNSCLRALKRFEAGL